MKIFPQTEARSLVISTEGRVLGIKALMLPSGKIAEKHKKLMSKAETFQMLIPQNMPGAFIPQFIGKIYVNRAQKLKEITEKLFTSKPIKGCAYLQVDLSLIERWLKIMRLNIKMECL